MGLILVTFTFSFIILCIVNISWLGLNLYSWAIHGLQFLLQGMNFGESVYASTFLKWIILADSLWLLTFFGFLLKRKQYKTDPKLHYLKYIPIKEPKICVVIPAYNEEENIEQIVTEFIQEEYVKQVIVVDNNSEDNTV